jgi:hypothetical protein
MNREFNTIQHYSTSEFNAVALDLFYYQKLNNAVYSNYIEQIKRDTFPSSYQEIPYLPVSAFKSSAVYCGASEHEAQTIFSSSSTGGIPSLHYVKDLSLYRQSFLTCFHQFYGKAEDYLVLALLPSYLERTGSSLIYMAEHLITLSKHNGSGFFLNEFDKIASLIQENPNRKILLLGVTYALLDFCEYLSAPFQNRNLIVMETGGMKGKRKELVRSELHKILCTQLGVSSIHSEYGMTELLSQAYSQGEGIFRYPAWMKVNARKINDPFQLCDFGENGILQITDLANVHSCCFIETQDIGRVYKDGTFEVLGRMDNAELRGCNLMIS